METSNNGETIMNATMETTGLSKCAAAGLGRKFRCKETIADGVSVFVAWSDEARVEVWAGPAGAYAPEERARPIAAAATLSGHALRRIMAVAVACDEETSRFALGGTLLEIAEGSTLAVVATDGRRMHVGHLQPAAIAGQASPIVRISQWRAFNAAVRAAVRGRRGGRGRRIDQMIDAGSMALVVRKWQETGGEVVEITWQASSGGLSVRSVAPAIAGNFPRWRDCLPEGGERIPVDVEQSAAALAEYAPLCRAAEREGRARWKAEQAERKRLRQYAGGFYRHAYGVDCSPSGAVGIGAEWASRLLVAPVLVRLDHRFYAEALAAAAEWGAPSVVVAATDDREAVSFSTGDCCGPRFEAVIMPMTRD